MTLQKWHITLDNRRSLKYQKSSYIISWGNQDKSHFVYIQRGHRIPLNVYYVGRDSDKWGIKDLGKSESLSVAINIAKKYMRSH